MDALPITTRIDQWTRQRAHVSQRRRKPLAPPPPALPTETSWRDRLEQLPHARAEKVRAIREAICAGRYDIDARFAAWIDRIEPDPPPRPAA